MNVLITGGAGFIGSHLSELYLDRGDSVHIIDDLSTGSIKNISHLKANPRFSYTIDTINNRPVLAELVDDSDLVVHLAAAVGVKLIVENPVRTIEENVNGTEFVLEAAAKKRKPTLIASTSEVYGLSTDLPYREDSNIVMGATTKCRWGYACSKAVDEFLGLAYHREKGVPVTIVRLFNTVGPRQTGRYGMVIPNFVRQALAGEPITVYGDGTQSRCFGYVGDVVKALGALMDRPDTAGEVFNIGSAEEVSIGELAEMIKVMTESDSEIVQIPYEEAYEFGFEDMHRRIPDTTKLRGTIGFAPEVKLDEILKSVIEYYRSQASSSTSAEPSTV